MFSEEVSFLENSDGKRMTNFSKTSAPQANYFIQKLASLEHYILRRM